MIDGLVYKITDNTNGNVYYGSTHMTLKERMRKHITGHKAYNKGKDVDYCYSFKILDNGDYKEEILEQDLYENKEAMLWRERYYFENYECVNKNRPIITEEERLETLKECTKSYITNNRDKVNAKKREDYVNNREVNRERINELSLKRYHKNMEDPAFREKERVRNSNRNSNRRIAKKEKKEEEEKEKQNRKINVAVTVNISTDGVDHN